MYGTACRSQRLRLWPGWHVVGVLDVHRAPALWALTEHRPPSSRTEDSVIPTSPGYPNPGSPLSQIQFGHSCPSGLGLGAFRRVVLLLYPLFLVSPDHDIGHAPNLFLQKALDLGIPGLVGYLALAGTALWLVWWVVSREEGRNTTDGSYAWLALGVFVALVAYQVHGLIDAAIALGAKAGLSLWMLFALAAVLWMTGPEAAVQLEPEAGQVTDRQGP